MAHILYTTHHIQGRNWVAYAIPVALVMASIVWVVTVFGERPTFGVDWDRSQVAPPSSNSVPAAGYSWSEWIQRSRPSGILDLPKRLGGKCSPRSTAAPTSPCDDAAHPEPGAAAVNGVDLARHPGNRVLSKANSA